MSSLAYGVAACQTDLPLPVTRREMNRNTDRILYLIDQAVTGYAPFHAIRLVVFPEFAHSGRHRAAATTNLFILETVRRHYLHRYPRLTTVELQPKNGKLPLPPGPGLGVDLKPELLTSDRVKVETAA